MQEDDVILQWMIRWVAMNASRFLVGKDGKTGYERRQGRKCKLHSVPIGEKSVVQTDSEKQKSSR